METDRAPIAGVDIDGVLADPTHRLHHLSTRPKNWQRFFASVDKDAPLPEGKRLVSQLQEDGIALVYVSGRPEFLRRATVNWLDRHGFPQAPLYLRPRGDFRPAPVLKQEVYRRMAEEFEIRQIVDDDERVVETLRTAGFPVPGPAPFVSPALRRWRRPASSTSRLRSPSAR